jgi:hypothetical protein
MTYITDEADLRRIDEGYELGNQYCKEWGCRKMGQEKYNGFCEEHEEIIKKDIIIPEDITKYREGTICCVACYRLGKDAERKRIKNVILNNFKLWQDEDIADTSDMIFKIIEEIDGVKDE